MKYVNFIYWALNSSSSGAYGDIGGVTPKEKIFQAATMLVFRVYFAFIAAEAANIVSTAYESYSENLEKVR